MEAIFGDADSCKTASPLEHIKGKNPPFLILYADKDFAGCNKMSDELCEALKKVKVEAASVEIKERDHGTIMRNAAQEDDPTLKAILEFVAKHSKSGK
jgi:alpha-beta hydrolase superfamily lysophospholipase